MVAQILALTIFVVMFGLIISEKFERHVITLVCGLATLVLVFGVAMHSMDAILETLNIRNIFTLSFWYEAGASSESTGGINWATIIFLAGMMVMVEGMAKAGFFRWLCMTIAKAVRYRVIPIFITFMIMSFVLAMFIDSITVILFLAAVTVELAQLLDFNPIPLILSEIFCANLGGSATMCGDPPNIIVGTSLRYSFSDFITNTDLMAVLSLVVIIFYFYFCFRKELTASSASQTSEKDHPSPVSAITDKRAFAISCVIFLCAVALLITHAQTGLTVAFIGLFIAILVLLTSGKNIGYILKNVDYKTILFFIGLFVVVGGLEQTGILEVIYPQMPAENPSYMQQHMCAEILRKYMMILKANGKAVDLDGLLYLCNMDIQTLEKTAMQKLPQDEVRNILASFLQNNNLYLQVRADVNAFAGHLERRTWTKRQT